MLIVIAIIAIVAGVVFVALNPLERFRDSRNAKRWSDVRSIADAVRIYQFDNNGNVPSGVDENWRILGTDTTGCDLECNGAITDENSSTDNNQSTFSNGTYSNTQYDAGNSWVELSSGTSGDYTSGIKDADSAVAWNNLAWVSNRPTYKELPNNQQSESSYSTGNISMANNILLLHMNDSSGTVVDSSGQGNNFTSYNSPTYGATGKLKTALDFDGTNDYLANTSFPFNFQSNNWTISIWAKAETSFPQEVGAGLISNREYGHPWFSFGYRYGYMQLEYTYSGTSVTYLNTNFNPKDNAWHHYVLRKNGQVIEIYIDGVYDSETSTSLNIDDYPSTDNLFIGKWLAANQIWNGSIDETSIWSRAISAGDILSLYRRGASKLQFHVKTCAQSDCSDGTFMGPDGTGSTYYSEIYNSDVGTPSLGLTNLDENRYFQYKTYFETDNASYSPELVSVTASNDYDQGSLDQTSCLNLSNILNSHLPTIPQDPSTGSSEKTYYAVRRQTTGQVDVAACSAEGGESIRVTR